MDNLNNIILTEADFQKLSALVATANRDGAELLEEELGRAVVVDEKKLPKDVVSMNSKIIFQDLENGKERSITLVYPHEANIQENKISVLAPVGVALIGLRVGQIIQWPVPNGKEKRFKVISVLAHQHVK